jgi:hypothetical protein
MGEKQGVDPELPHAGPHPIQPGTAVDRVAGARRAHLGVPPSTTVRPPITARPLCATGAPDPAAAIPAVVDEADEADEAAPRAW